MSQSPITSAATPDAVDDGEPNVVNDGTSDAPVVITAQQVVLSTAAVISPRPATLTRRVIEAIGGLSAARYRPRAHRHYPAHSAYLESARMAREMDRL